MEVHFPPELEEKLNDLAGRAGVEADKLVQDVMAGYVDSLTELRATLDGRYDELKRGSVQPIDGEAFFESLRRREKDRLNETSL